MTSKVALIVSMELAAKEIKLLNRVLELMAGKLKSVIELPIKYRGYCPVRQNNNICNCNGCRYEKAWDRKRVKGCWIAYYIERAMAEVEGENGHKK